MNYSFIFAVIFFLLTPCKNLYAFKEAPFEKFDVKKNMTKKTSMTWTGIDTDINDFCQKESKKRGFGGFGYHVDACTFWDQDILGNDVCTVYTPSQVNLVMLGHEVRHCFQGAWHK
jgi:hypothetical protein